LGDSVVHFSKQSLALKHGRSDAFNLATLSTAEARFWFWETTRRKTDSPQVDVRSRELVGLERIRRRFPPAAAACNCGAKAIISVAKQMIAERERGRPDDRSNGRRLSAD